MPQRYRAVFSIKRWFVRNGRFPLIRRLRRQLPPRGKPLEKTAGAAFDRKPSPGQGKVPPLAADEAEAVPLHKANGFIGSLPGIPVVPGSFFDKAMVCAGRKIPPHLSPAATASPRGKPLEKTAGAAFDRKPSPGQGKVPPLAADEAETVPLHKANGFIGSLPGTLWCRFLFLQQQKSRAVPFG